MEIVTSSSLIRGAAFIDFALSKGRALDLSVADTVGMVAAYIAHGGAPSTIEKELSDRLTPSIARQVDRAFSLFEDYRGRGLWAAGAAADDVKFTHPLLDQMYPNVNAEHELFERSMRSF